MYRERIMELGTFKFTGLAFHADTLDHTLPVSPDVEDITSLGTIFYPTTYEKGTIILN